MARVNGTTSSDTLYGTYFKDDIYGNNGNDVIFALDGNDIIDGEDGFDILYGGNGNDLYCLFSTANSPSSANNLFFYDSVIETEDGGSDDTIVIFPSIQSINRISAVETFYNKYTMPEFIESIAIQNPNPLAEVFNPTTRRFDIDGNNLDNRISGSAGANVLSGKGGKDIIRGFAGMIP